MKETALQTLRLVEKGEERWLNARPVIPLQPVEKTVVDLLFPLQPVEDRTIIAIQPAAVLQQVDMP